MYLKLDLFVIANSLRSQHENQPKNKMFKSKFLVIRVDRKQSSVSMHSNQAAS